MAKHNMRVAKPTPAATPAATPASANGHPAPAAVVQGAPAAAQAAPTAQAYAEAVAATTGNYAPHLAKVGVAYAAVTVALGPKALAAPNNNPKRGASAVRWGACVATLAANGGACTVQAWLAAGHTMPDLLWGLAPKHGLLVVQA